MSLWGSQLNYTVLVLELDLKLFIVGRSISVDELGSYSGFLVDEELNGFYLFSVAFNDVELYPSKSKDLWIVFSSSISHSFNIINIYGDCLWYLSWGKDFTGL